MAFTATSNGDWLYSAESGAMAFINMRDTNGQFTDEDLVVPNATKRISIGRQGVNASRMILDTVHGEDLLYIAGGRDGLWVMDADPDGNILTNRAWRVDDSGNANVATQNSRRWCSDVQIATVDDVPYLVAVFGRRSNSVLRVYRLSDVRAIADPANSELGHEIPAFAQAVVGSNPSSPAPGPDTAGRSIAMAFDCVVQGSPGNQLLMVYLAMGPHGLARVRFDPASNGTSTIGVSWGPVFGSGSHYHNGNGLVPNVPASTYQDSVYINGREFFDTPEIDRIEAPPFTDVKVFRGTVTDSGVSQDVYQVYATLDHLNWVMFELDHATGAGWSQTMPIAHHEGVHRSLTTTGIFGSGAKEAMFVIDDSFREVLGYANSIEILEQGPTGSPGPYLLVGHTHLPYLRNFLEFRQEGITFGPTFDQAATTDDHRPAGTPRTVAVFVYEVQATYSSDTSSSVSPNLLTWSRPSGGNLMFAPPIQQEQGQLAVFHSFISPMFNSATGSTPEFHGLCLSLIDITTPYNGADPPLSQTFWRDPELGHMDGGYVVFHARPAIADPRLVLTATNDDPQKRASWLTVQPLDPLTGERSIEALPLDPASAPVDPDFKIHAGPNALLVPEDCQWFSPNAQGDQALFVGGANEASSVNPPGIPAGGGRWTLMDLQVKDGAGELAPRILRHWHFFPRLDRFNYFPRLSFQSASTMGQEFDNLVGPTQGFAFLSQVFTAEGLTAIPRSVLEDVLSGVINEPSGTDFEVGDDDLSDIGDIRLVTHPEFNNMLGADELVANGINLEDYWDTTDQSVDGNDARGRIYTWTPTVMRVASPGTSNLDRWIIAAPAGQVVADERWHIYEGVESGPSGTIDNARFLPEQLYLDHNRKAMVRFWAMSESQGAYQIQTAPYVTGSDFVAGNSPLPTWLADPSTDEGHAWFTKNVILVDDQGDLRSFCLVGDFAGRLEAVEVTDILSTGDASQTDRSLNAVASGSGLRLGSLPNGTWTSPLAMHDTIQPLVFDAAVSCVENSDRALVYVAVKRVGIFVLEFTPFETQVFRRIKLLTVPNSASSVSLLPSPIPGAGNDSLLISAYGAGIRVFDRE